MPEILFCIMMALVKIGGCGRRTDISDVAGYDIVHFSSTKLAVNPLYVAVRLGWVTSPWKGMLNITERGKIALAIEVGRRRRGVRYISHKMFAEQNEEES